MTLLIRITLNFTEALVMTVGSAKKVNENVVANRIAEIYDHSTRLWNTKAFYPFRDALVDYQILPLNEDFLILGGIDDESSIIVPTIAKFNPTKNIWTKLGNMQFKRHGFGAIEIQKQFLIMGGEGKIRTEICEITGEKAKCKSREPTLNNFLYYPAMMIIETEYTDRCKNFSMIQKATTSKTKSTTKITTLSTTKSLMKSTTTHKG